MAVSERARHELYEELGRQLGQERATTLMEMLPRTSWDDVVTTGYLSLELQAMEHRLTAMFHQELAKHTRTFVFATLTAVISSGSLAFAAAAVLGP